MRKRNILLITIATMILSTTNIFASESEVSIQELQEKIIELENRVNILEGLLNIASGEQETTDNVHGESITLGSGLYVIGEDIAEGKYDIITTNGAGSIYIYDNFETYDNDDIWDNYFHLAAEGTEYIEEHSDMFSVSISNLRLTSGKCMVVDSGLEVQLISK